MGLESQPKHLTVLLLARIPAEAVRSPFLCRSGCQQCILLAPSSRNSSAFAMSAMGSFRLMKRMSGMPAALDFLAFGCTGHA
jgi:hypothetical protein